MDSSGLLNYIRLVNIYFRCKIWIQNIENHSLENKDPIQLQKSYRVCGEHFKEDFYMNKISKNRLVHNAVPTEFNGKSSLSRQNYTR